MKRIALALLAATVLVAPARADFTGKDASASTITFFAFTCFTTKVCASHVNVNSAGTEIFTISDPGNVSITNLNTNGRASAANSAPIVPAYLGYQAVAASATATVLQTSTGATGDYLSHCVLFPTSVDAGLVTVFDNTNTALNNAITFAGGTASTSNLTPITVPVGAVSVHGAWKVTTGSGISVVCYGNFS